MSYDRLGLKKWSVLIGSLKEIIFCSAKLCANLKPGTDKKIKRSTLQRLHEKSRFCVSSVVRRSYIIRYINNLYQRSNRRAFWKLMVWFAYRKFSSWRNPQQMNTTQKAMTRTLWKPLMKICNVWYVIYPLKSQFKRDVATDFAKIALRNTS